METSPGTPYIFQRRAGQSGKRFLFNGEPGSMVIANDDLRSRLDEREREARLGRLVPTTWIDCMKDERRPLLKIYEGKTRIFNIGPVDYTILFRKYVLAFAAMYYDTHLDHEGAPGIDCESPEWTKLTARLQRVSNNMIACDFKQFDGKLDPQLMGASMDIVNMWYDDGPTNILVRQVLMEDMIHSYHQVNGCLYQTHRGNPSGNPMTCIINSMVNALYQRCIFLEIMEETSHWSLANMRAYNDYTCFFFYGDDLIAAIASLIISFYNQVSICEAFAKHGFVVTTADKAEVARPFEQIGDVSFLKRSFRQDPVRPNIWHPTIDKVTIQELTNWIRVCGDPTQAMYDNLDVAMRFAYHHGAEFFSAFQRQVNRALFQRNLPGLSYSYTNMRTQFWEMF